MFCREIRCLGTNCLKMEKLLRHLSFLGQLLGLQDTCSLSPCGGIRAYCFGHVVAKLVCMNWEPDLSCPPRGGPEECVGRGCN